MMLAVVAAGMGLGLVLLAIAGASYHTPGWLLGLELAGAAAAAITAWALASARRFGGILAGLLAIGLLLLWLVGVAAGAAFWLAWWNFGFAAGFLILAFASFALSEPAQRVR